MKPAYSANLLLAAANYLSIHLIIFYITAFKVFV